MKSGKTESANREGNGLECVPSRATASQAASPWWLAITDPFSDPPEVPLEAGQWAVDEPPASIEANTASPDPPGGDHWDWFEQLFEEDAAYLLGPRSVALPCPWCGGRLHHSRECIELREAWEETMPFGKYKGRPVAKVPGRYLRWLLAKSTRLTEELRFAIESTLARSSSHLTGEPRSALGVDVRP